MVQHHLPAPYTRKPLSQSTSAHAAGRRRVGANAARQQQRLLPGQALEQLRAELADRFGPVSEPFRDCQLNKLILKHLEVRLIVEPGQPRGPELRPVEEETKEIFTYSGSSLHPCNRRAAVVLVPLLVLRAFMEDVQCSPQRTLEQEENGKEAGGCKRSKHIPFGFRE